MIYKFSCNNFRNISVENLPLKRINLLIGPNNSGKTNFIQAITFYSNMLKYSTFGSSETDFYNAVQRNGWSHCLRKGERPGTPISFTWDMELGQETISFKFAFVTGAQKEDFHIVQEELYGATFPLYDKRFNYFQAHKSTLGECHISTATHKGKQNKRLVFPLASNASIFSQFKDIVLNDEHLYNEASIRKNLTELMGRMEIALRSVYAYSSAQFDTRAIRTPVQENLSSQYLMHSGINLVNLFDYYKSKSLKWKMDFINHMKDLMHDLRDVDVVSIFGQNMMRLVDGDEEFDLTDISEGTIKALLLNFLVNMPVARKYPLLAIDEPESNLHPAWQKVVGEWIRSSDNFEQCMIGTHSPDFLDVFTDDFINDRDVAIFVFSGDGSIQPIKSEDVRRDIGDWELGDLYRTNDPLLGGWPW